MKLKCLIFVFITILVTNSRAMINSNNSDHQPYYAYIEYVGQNSGFGGGALISTTHVLTCASNIVGVTNWRIGLGTNRRSQHTHVFANRGVPHPNYRAENNIRSFDLGILFIVNPVFITPNVAPILLSPFSFHNSTNTQGMMLGYAGEQQSNQGLENLQAAHVRIIPENECETAFPGSTALDLFCGGDRTRRSNFCSGDQGGPFTVVSRGVEYLVGIGSLPGCSNILSTYMPVISFREWIRSETGV